MIKKCANEVFIKTKLNYHKILLSFITQNIERTYWAILNIFIFTLEYNYELIKTDIFYKLFYIKMKFLEIVFYNNHKLGFSIKIKKKTILDAEIFHVQPNYYVVNVFEFLVLLRK